MSVFCTIIFVSIWFAALNSSVSSVVSQTSALSSQVTGNINFFVTYFRSLTFPRQLSFLALTISVNVNSASVSSQAVQIAGIVIDSVV